MTCNEASLLSALAGGGYVSFYADCTIILTSSIHILADTTIEGNGHKAIFNANSLDWAFIVEAGARFNLIGVALRGPGGGIRIDDGILTVNNSTFENLTVSSGAAIEHVGSWEISNHANWLAVNFSTFKSNRAQDLGGAIFAIPSTKVTNSTFYGNGAGDGGAIRSNGELTVINCTFYGNSANPNGGGAISYIQEAGAFTLLNTILASNTGGNCSGQVTGASVGNMEYPAASCAPVGVTVAYPYLDALKDNGGPTETMLFKAYQGTHFTRPRISPALDAGDPAACAAGRQL